MCRAWVQNQRRLACAGKTRRGVGVAVQFWALQCHTTPAVHAVSDGKTETKWNKYLKKNWLNVRNCSALNLGTCWSLDNLQGRNENWKVDHQNPSWMTGTKTFTQFFLKLASTLQVFETAQRAVHGDFAADVCLEALIWTFLLSYYIASPLLAYNVPCRACDIAADCNDWCFFFF